MTRAQIIHKVESLLPPQEKIVGIFQAQKDGPFWHHLLLGPFASFLMEFYIICVTDKKLYFHRQKLSGKDFKNTQCHDFKQFSNILFKKGILQNKLNLGWVNGKTIKLKIPARGVKSLLLLEQNTLNFLKSNIKKLQE